MQQVLANLISLLKTPFDIFVYLLFVHRIQHYCVWKKFVAFEQALKHTFVPKYLAENSYFKTINSY